MWSSALLQSPHSRKSCTSGSIGGANRLPHSYRLLPLSATSASEIRAASPSIGVCLYWAGGETSAVPPSDIPAQWEGTHSSLQPYNQVNFMDL